MEWKGVMPAVTTKFTADGKIDYGLFLKNIEYQVDSGVNAVILAGTLGESSTLDDSEKTDLLAFTVEKVNGRIPVLLNIAEGSTRKAIETAKKAQEAGAEGLMLLPPMRYKADKREILEYFISVADSVSLPVMIYNNPVDYGTEVTLEMFESLLKKDNIQAVKESTRDVTNVTRIKNAFGDRLKILCGVDTLAMEELLMGADGWVAGLVSAFPGETVAIYNLIKQGNYDEARKIYRWFMPLLELDIHPKLVQYIKYAEQIEGVGSEYVRAPRLRLEGDERKRIENIVRSAIADRPVIKTKTEKV